MDFADKLSGEIFPKSFEKTSYDNRYLLEIRSTEDKGKAIFAIEDIPRGTIILAESPLILATDRASAYQAFIGLTYPEQVAYLRLHGMLSASSLDLQDSTLDPPQLEIRCKIVSIWHMNSFAGAVLEIASRFNHSCIPNTHMGYQVDDNPENIFEFRVSRDVTAGEELSVAYIHPFMARSERQAQFKGWEFECTCPACEDTDQGNENESKIVAMTALYHELEDEARGQFEPTDEGATLMKRRLPKLQKITALLQSLGLLSGNLLKYYQEATICCAVIGNAQMALLWAEKAADITLSICGEKMHRTQDARIVTQLQAAVKRSKNKPLKHEHIRWPGPGDLRRWMVNVMSMNPPGTKYF